MDFSWIIYILIILLGILVGLLQYKYLNRSSYKSWLLLISVLIVELMAYVFRMKNDNNLIIYHFSIPLYLIIFYWIFKTEIYLPLKISNFIFLILFLTILSGVFFQKFTKAFPSNLYLLSSFLVIIFALMYLQQLLKVKEIVSVFDYPLFLISFGLLFFHTINLFGFGAFKFIYFQQNNTFTSFFTLLRKVSNYILYLTFIIAFLSKQTSINNGRQL
jgi:hypothetical protein